MSKPDKMEEMSSYNIAMNTNFKFEIHDPKAESLNYFIQDAIVPGLSMPSIEGAYLNEQVFLPTNRIDYDAFNTSFIVAEDLSNYFFIYDWLHKLREVETPFIHARDGTLHIFSNNKTYNIEVRFYGMFPTSLGELSFLSNTLSTEPLVCMVTFAYEWFEIYNKDRV